MQSEAKQFQTDIQGVTFNFETGKLAGQAGGAVTLRVGDTMVFAAVTMSSEERTGIDFFPLTVDYEERMYAGGRIPGSFFRREGRPSEGAILTARLTDRPLRPLFPKDMRNDVQVILYSLSTDGENPIDILAVNAASTALMVSDIPWGGPIGAVRVGHVEGEFIANPTFAELEISDLDLRLAGTRDAILMVECAANQVPEATMLAALEFGHQAIQPLFDLQEQMAAQAGKPKRAYTSYTADETLRASVIERARGQIESILEQPYEKANRDNATNELRAAIVAEFGGEDETMQKDIASAFDDAYRQVVRAFVLERGLRADGRGLTDIRNIWCEVDVSPRAHGSGLFTRGETQVLTLATLGTPREAQELDSLTPAETKRYMHHYNFPPFSTGEARPLRGASRRDIGHGALAERSLVPVLPPEDEFPYTLRLVSEVLSSNGSSSMASVCGSTLALMDTGVPIKAPVAGVAMGLIKEGERFKVLTDILGLEDHLGDMDFKVAGTDKGITALQMDIKIKGITSEIMAQALEQARQARLAILDKMLAVIPAPKPDLKPHAPRITVVHIPVEKIGAVIGPGGKVIRAIQEDTGAKIDINEDGSVFIATADGESARIAQERIEALTESAVIGRIYTGKVVRVADFGAFVEILPNIDGMVHISQLDTQRVNKVEDVVRMGDEITVMVTDIDEQGKIRLSRQAVLEGWSAEEALERDRRGRSGGSRSGGRSSGGSRSGGRPGDRHSSGGDRKRR
ncbi:MAG: polyribonucleotide nucleotidyltransferase [Anaerolineales bacterium]|nr:polyribonucleotide nucleotidyltransferase [Anaerolineales bacterium]